LLRAGLKGREGLLSLQTRLAVDVIGLGASAKTHYPPVGRALRCRMILPHHADVANAIGAVVGQIEYRARGTVTSPSEGKYRAHMPNGPEDFAEAEAAMAHLESYLTESARSEVLAAGAEDITLKTERAMRKAEIEAREVFVEAELVVTASGRPRITDG
ncbi:MAG: hydantoinase/oxoprolinase family protein, partial [Rhodobacteraceae bacterium]|nr:hydantoinase/oxoprolinase family protein [Paracoccaceae bacterium]